MVSRSGIEEANRHIQALNGRIYELENIAKEQHNALIAKDVFIQTKIQELMTQDRKIKELSDRLNSAYEEIKNQSFKISSLESDLSEKDLHILKLEENKDKTKTLIQLLPDLNAVVDKINTAYKLVNEGNNKHSQHQEELSESNSADDGNTNEAIQEDGLVDDEISVFSEMAHNLIKTQRHQKFSISEDDDVDNRTLDSSPLQKTPEKEFYL